MPFSSSTRIFWVVVLVISFVLTIHLTYKFIKSTEKNPIVIYVEEQHVNVVDLNFPAITLCPGLILADADLTKLDYNKTVGELENGKMSIENLTENESANNFFLLNHLSDLFL